MIIDGSCLLYKLMIKIKLIVTPRNQSLKITKLNSLEFKIQLSSM